MARRVGKPNVSEDVAERVRATMRELIESTFKNGSKLAKAMGMTQPSVSNLLNKRTTPSLDTVRRVATLAGKDLAEFLGEAHSAYPNRDQAIALVVSDRKLAYERVEDAADKYAKHLHGGDLSTLEWARKIEKMLDAQDLLDGTTVLKPGDD